MVRESDSWRPNLREMISRRCKIKWMCCSVVWGYKEQINWEKVIQRTVEVLESHFWGLERNGDRKKLTVKSRIFILATNDAIEGASTRRMTTARPQLQLHSKITKRETKDCQWMPVSVAQEVFCKKRVLVNPLRLSLSEKITTKGTKRLRVTHSVSSK